MDLMFWIWLGVIIVTAIIEFATMEIVSIWFTFGALIPLILSVTKAVSWEIQIIVFVVVSAILIVSLRSVTKKFLLKNSDGKTNLDSLIGQKFRMLSRTDFETIGSLKVNDVVWSAVGDKQQAIEKDEVVEIIKIQGNKLLVKKAQEEKIEKPMPKQTKEKEPEKKVEESAEKKQAPKKAAAPKKKTVQKTAPKETTAKTTAKTTAAKKPARATTQNKSTSKKATSTSKKKVDKK